MKEIDIANIARIIHVPLLVHDNDVAAVLVEDIHGTRSFWYQKLDGSVALPDYTNEDEWALFDELIKHVGWE